GALGRGGLRARAPAQPEPARLRAAARGAARARPAAGLGPRPGEDPMTAVDPPRTADIQIARFEGGGRWITGGGLLGVVLIAITLIGAVASGNPSEAMFSYLVAFAYWCGLAMASLVLLLIMHATRARWVTVIRRPLEVMAASVGIFLLLAIPI